MGEVFLEEEIAGATSREGYGAMDRGHALRHRQQHPTRRKVGDLRFWLLENEDIPAAAPRMPLILFPLIFSEVKTPEIGKLL